MDHRLAPSSLKIQALALVLAGLGAFVFFANPNDFFPPEPEVTPTIEEAVPTPNELPLGSKNPCWAGIYPRALDLPEWEHIPASDFLVDPETNDTYDAVCVGVQLSAYKSHWPPGIAERLVRASDL